MGSTRHGRCSRRVDPDIEWWEREDVPDPTVHRGLTAVGTRFAELDDMWIGLGLEPQEFIDAGDFPSWCHFA